MSTITCINLHVTGLLPPPWAPNPQEDCPCPQPARRRPSAAALPSTPLSSTLCTPAPSETEVTALCKLLTPACGQPREVPSPPAAGGGVLLVML